LLAWIKNRRSLGLALLITVMLITAGCQAVGGLDLNKMIKQTFKVTAFEGSQTIDFKLLFKEDAEATDDFTKLLSLLTQYKIELNEMKMKDAEHLSFKGTLELGGGKPIGFSVAVDEKLAVVNLDGAVAPFVFHLDEAFGLIDEEEGLSAEDRDSIVKTGKELLDIVSGFAIDNLPNPTRLKVAPVTEQVLGESLNVMHVQAELDGKEIWSWSKSYLDALIADKEGLRAMLTSVFKLTQEQNGVLESAAESIFGSLPEDEDAAIREATDQITGMLQDIKKEMDESEKNNGSDIDLFFNKQTNVKADLYVDSSLDIRKSVVEATIKPTLTDEDEDVPFEGIWFKTTSELKNVNGTVTPETPKTSAADVNIEQLFSMHGYQVLRQFDKNSAIYDLLRNKLHISKQEVMLHPEYSYPAPIVMPSGITLVPLRNTAEQLGATLEVSLKAKQITLVDEGTGTTIRLVNGNKQVNVNGKTIMWSFPVSVVDGITYVPARDFVKALGGKLYWEEDPDFGRYLMIEREL